MLNTPKFIIYSIFSLFILKTKAEYIKGRIIRDKDTLVVDFKIDLDEGANSQSEILLSLQNGVSYIKGGTYFLKPDSAQSIEFDLSGVRIKMASVSNTLGPTDYSKPVPKVFLQLELDGKAKLLNFYIERDKYETYFGSSSNLEGFILDAIISAAKHSAGPIKLTVLKKGNLPLISFSRLKFKETGAYYFKDCPDIAEKIKQKKYTVDDLQMIVSLYNTTCASK